MDSEVASYRFGELTLDMEASRLLGPEGEIRLRPQAFRMLEVLIESAPKILSQEELLDRVWGVEHLSPASVKQAVSEVRQALGDDPARPRIIETVHRRGYRFIASIERIEPVPPPSPAVPEAPRKDELATQPMAMDNVLARLEGSPPAPSPPAGLHGWLSIALLIPLVTGLAVMALLARSLPGRAARPATVAAPEAGSPSRRPAVAILGFRNLSKQPQDAWISGALGEILGFELTAPGRLRIIPADNVVRMQGEIGLQEDEDETARLERIGRNLGTHLVITGSYLVSRPAGSSGMADETIRLQVMVQDVRTGETVAWARETGTREEILSLATSAARGILGSLGESPGAAPREAAALAANAESLRLWSEAMSRLRVSDAMEAVPLLQKAASIDPDNPFIHDALAVAWSRLGFDGRAAEAAGKALALATSGLPDEIRMGLEARALEMRFEQAEAAKRYAELWRLFADNLEYGLALASMQRRSGAAEASLATVEALRKLPAPDGEDPRIDLAESEAAWRLGDLARSRDAAQRAIERAQARSAARLAAMGRVSRGWALSRLGQGDAALADFRAAVAIYQRVGDRGAAAGARAAEALIHQGQGRAAEARRIYGEVIPVFREIGDRTREARTLNNFAALIGQEDLAETAALLERSLAIKREIEDHQGIATTLANLGNLRAARGDAPGARSCLEESIRISRRLSDPHGTALALRGIARLHAQEGRFGDGRAALAEAIGLNRQMGDVDGLAQSELALASLEKKAGRLDEAHRHYTASLALWTELENQEMAAEVRAAMAELGRRGSAEG